MPKPDEVPDRKQAIEAHRARGGGLAAVFPIHHHRALLRSFGLLPVEVWGPPGIATNSGDAHLQAYTCSIVRCGLSFLLDGGLDQVDLVLVPHACDSLQGLGSLLLDFAPPKQPVLTLYLPRGQRAADVAHLAAELKRLYEQLSGITGRRPNAAALHQAIDHEERADAALGELLAARPRLDWSNRAFYRLARSREYLPAEDFEPLARSALALAGQEPEPGAGITLSGLTPEPKSVLDALDAAGIKVVADDLACCGRRVYPARSAADPFERMAASLLAGPPDSTRGSPVEDRLAHLLTLGRRANARGVIFFAIKFCEPEQFYLPQLSHGLTTAGIRTLALEVDIADPLPDQVVTRLEAFAETLA